MALPHSHYSHLEKLFERRKNETKWNTSYPLSPSDWQPYSAQRSLSFSKEKDISFYVHIPFCQHLCSFCEYSRMHSPSDEWQAHYLEVVRRDMMRFAERHPHLRLNGFDLGGGTPTALSPQNFNTLLQCFREFSTLFDRTDDFEPSIEGTFATMSEEKIQNIAEKGIQRVSLGLQTANAAVLQHQHRPSASLSLMDDVMNQLRKHGIRKVNLDMMYGLHHQTLDTLQEDVALLTLLQPEQVTLYELRTNMIAQTMQWNKENLFKAYAFLYDALTGLGYHAAFGQNTFSKFPDDLGVSSYLRHRMTAGSAYKGFGLSAQSMCREGVSYNVGKGTSQLVSLIRLPSYEEGDVYLLPPQEIAAKYIAIAAYAGAFSLERLSEILGCDAQLYYAEALDFCLSNELLSLEDKKVRITSKGYAHYGAVFSLFYRP